MMSSKTGVLVVVIAMMVALTVLATGFDSLEFSGGRGFTFALDLGQADDDALFDNITTSNASQSRSLKLFFDVLLYGVIPASLIYAISTRSGRASLRRALRDSMIAGIMYIALWRGLHAIQFNLQQRAGGSGGTVQPETIPAIFVATVSLGLAVGLLAVGWLLYKRWQARTEPVDAVGDSAREAIRALKSGGDLRDIIVRCYHTMLDTVREAGVERQEHVTPREFETRLVQMGLPSTDVQQLTRLFEQVRYGSAEVTHNQEAHARALGCLTSIVHAVEVKR